MFETEFSLNPQCETNALMYINSDLFNIISFFLQSDYEFVEKKDMNIKKCETLVYVFFPTISSPSYQGKHFIV